MTEFSNSDDLGAVIAEDRNRRRAAGSTDFLEDFAGLPKTDAQASAAPETYGPPMPPKRRTPGEVVGAVAADIGRGVTETPKQMVGGALDALYSLGSLLNSGPEYQLDLGATPDEGVKSITQTATAKEVEDRQRAAYDTIRPADAATVTGGLVRGVSQFLTGFAVGAKGMGGVTGATKAATFSKAAGASMFSDFAAFDGHEERLSNLIESYPALQNPVTEFLQSDEADSELEGRLKNVAEGVLSDAAVTGLVAVLKGVRVARKAKAAVGGESYADAAKRLADDPEVAKNLPAPELTGARKSELPLVSKAVEDVGPETAANALAGSKVAMPDGDVFVNWSRIDTADDVKSVIQQMADAGKDEIDQARRGVRTNAETKLSAAQEDAWKTLAERRQGQPLNAEKSLAVRQLWAASGERVLAAARAMRDAPNPENTFLFRRAVALHGAIQREVISARTETARALQQWSIPAGSNEVAARQIGEAVDAFGGADVADGLAARILGAADQGNLAAVDNMTRRGALAATFDAVHEYWINAILSGPKTHLVNMMSNTGVAVLSVIERATAAGVGALRGGADRVALREAGVMLHSAVASLPDAWRFAARNLMGGESQWGGLHRIEAPRVRALSTEALGDTKRASFNAMMNAPVIAQGVDAIGSVVNIPTRMLGAEDEFFKTISYRMELHAQALRQASDELGAAADPAALKSRIADIMENPPDSVALRAREFAQYNTFTNDAGKFVSKVRAIREKWPLLKFILPFMNTPANIFRFAAERSPAAPLLQSVRADVAAGGRRADMALAKMGLGSAAMMTAFDMAMNGQITGSGPSSYNERQLLERTGWQPNSVKIGDRYFAYNRLDPLGMQLGIAANMAEMALNGDIDPGEDYMEAVSGSMGAVGGMMMDKTYFRGLADLFNTMSDPQRYSEGFVNRFGASFVPAAVREVEAYIDPELRRASSLMETIRSKIPGLSEDLPVRHDLWGRPRSYASSLGETYDAISPIYSSKEKAEPIDLELKRLNYFPGLPSTTITEQRERFLLKNKPKLYEDYVVLQGATPASAFPINKTPTGRVSARAERMAAHGDMTLMQALNAIVEGKHPLSAEYADADDQGREDMVRNIITDFRASAKDKLIADNPEAFQPGTGQK